MFPRAAVAVAAIFVGALACASVIGLDAYGIAAPDAGVTEASIGDAATDDAATTSGVDGITIAPPELTIEDAPCGVAKAGAVTLTNSRDVAVPFEVTLPANDLFVIEGATGGVVKGELPPKESRAITVTGKNSSVEVRGVDLQIKLDGTVVPYSVKLVTRGPRLAVSPATLDFGDIRTGTTANATVLFKNEGTDPVTITGFGAANADFTLPSSLTVAASGETPAEVTMTAGPTGPIVTATITPALSATVCGPVPTLVLKGHRVDQDTLVNPVTLDFGTQFCGTAPATSLKVTISNYRTSSPVSFTTSLTSATFKVTPPSGSVPAADGATPKKLDLVVNIADTNGKPGDRNETLDVNISGPGFPNTTTKIALHVKTSGALVQLDSPNVDVPNQKTVHAGITNVGNIGVCVEYEENSINDRYFGVEADRGDLLQPNDRNDIDVEYDARGRFEGPQTSGPLPRVAPITITAVPCANGLPVTPLCGPIPTLTVTGTGGDN